MTFSEDAWQSVGDWFGAILDHPFLSALADGGLEEATFARYLVDDMHYLDGYARALATIASRAPDHDGIELFAGSAAAAIAAERQTHSAFLTPRGIGPESAEPTPTCRAYVGSLQVAAAYGPVEVAVAAVLPCFRVYGEVGRALLALQPGEHHPYAAWIHTYGSPEFDEAVRAAESYADRLAADATDARLNDMTRAYREATRFEWMFWDAAWRGEGWPVPMRSKQSQASRPARDLLLSESAHHRERSGVRLGNQLEGF